MAERAIQQQITACWNAASSSYDDHAGHGLRSEEERLAWLAMLRDVLPDEPCDVLDVGTGTGFLAFRAHELGHRVTGVDLSEEMLAIARRESTAKSANAPEFRTGDAIAPPLPPGSFDVVMNRHLLWTLVDPDRALESWRELLRPQGLLVIVDGIWPGDADADATDDDDDDDAEEDEHEGEEFYTPEVLAALPITGAASVADVIRLIESANFVDVREIDLSGIDEAEGHLDSVRGRYALVATRGA